MPGSYADAQLQVWTPLFALPPLTACTGLSKANLCIVYGHFPRSQRETSTLRAICIKRMERGARQEQMFHVKHSAGSPDGQIPGGRIAGWPSNGKFFRDCGELRGNAARQNIATWCFARRSVPLRRNREEHAAETPQSRKNLPHTGKALRREGGGAGLGMGTRLRHAARGAAARRAPCRGGPTLRPARGPAGSRR